MRHYVEILLNGGITVAAGTLSRDVNDAYYVTNLEVSVYIYDDMLRNITDSLRNKDFVYFEKALVDHYLVHGDADVA